jgi:hypothetical protein
MINVSNICLILGENLRILDVETALVIQGSHRPFMRWHLPEKQRTPTSGGKLVHQVSDRGSSAAAYFGWMREAKRENTRWQLSNELDYGKGKSFGSRFEIVLHSKLGFRVQHAAELSLPVPQSAIRTFCLLAHSTHKPFGTSPFFHATSRGSFLPLPRGTVCDIEKRVDAIQR